MSYVWLQPPRGPCLSLCFTKRRLAQHVPFDHLCTAVRIQTVLELARAHGGTQTQAKNMQPTQYFVRSSSQICVPAFPISPPGSHISELANQLRVYSWRGRNPVSEASRWLRPNSSGASKTHKKNSHGLIALTVHIHQS